MYLEARLLGIFCYILIFLITVYIIKNISEKKSKYILSLFLVILSVIAFLYEPAQEADLYRIRIYANDFSHYSWSQFLYLLKSGQIGLSKTPLAAIFYKITGDINCVELIPLVSCVVCFGLLFIVLIKTQKKFLLSNSSLVMAILWFFSIDYFMPAIATVRSYIAAALIFICVYREAEKQKTDILNIFIYLMSILIHSIGLIFVIIRITAVVFQKNIRTIIKLAYICVMGVAFVFVLITNSSIIEYTYNYAIGYLTSNSSYSYIWEIYILIIALMGQICILRKVKKREFSSSYIEVFYNVAKFGVLIQVLFFWQFSILQRVSFFTALMTMPLLMAVTEKNSSRRKWSINFFSVSACIMLLITCSRGYLCSLKFW